jgi:hypothetical protein
VLEVQQPQQRVDRDRGTAKPAVEQHPPRLEEALIVQVGVNLGQLSREALEFLGQQQFPDRGLWVALAQHQCLQGMRRQENHNGVIHPRTGPYLPAFPQLNRPFHLPFFRGK